LFPTNNFLCITVALADKQSIQIEKNTKPARKRKNHRTSKNQFQVKKTPSQRKKEKSLHEQESVPDPDQENAKPAKRKITTLVSTKIRSWTARPPNSLNTTIAAVPHKTEILNCSSPLTRCIPQLLHCSSSITFYASRLHLLDLYRLPPFLR